jgi:virginiamycin B lyase
MKRFFFALLLLTLFSPHELRADIAGYALGTPALDLEIHPRLVSAAANGNVWFAQQAAIPYSIGFFTPSGHVTNFPVPCTKCTSGEEIVYVWALASDPDSSVWFIDNHAKSDGTSIDSAVGHLTADGQFKFFPIPTKNATAVVRNGFGQSSLALAADGTIWFTENATFKFGRLSPSTGTFAEYSLEGPEQPSGITISSDGKIWFTAADHEIAQVTPPSNGEFVEFSLAGGAYPLGITTGADGNIWLTEAGRHKIARLRPSGTINEFPLPTDNGAPQHIVSAPDGTLWYTESTGMDIGRITLNGSSAPTFEVAATPGQQNFDLTVTGSGLVYFTGRDIASGQDKLSLLAPACANGPFVQGPYELTATLSFHGAISIGGQEPLNITIQNLPASWTAQVGTVTIIDSGASPALGTYTFTISVVDAGGCSISQQITVHIVDKRRRSARH